MSEQVSSIPAPQTPRPKPRFIFLDSSSVIDIYNSFAKRGFALLLSSQAEFPYQQEKTFLSRVDLTKNTCITLNNGKQKTT